MKSGSLEDQYLPDGKLINVTPIVLLDPESVEYKERFAGLPKGWKEYITSESWKCVDSPTGAHHWLRVDEYFIWVCIWCCGRKKMPTRTYAKDVALGLEDQQPARPGVRHSRLEGKEDATDD